MRLQHRSSDYSVRLRQTRNGMPGKNNGGRAFVQLPSSGNTDARQQRSAGHAPKLMPSRWSFGEMMSRFAAYIVADLAKTAIALHPEAMFFLDEDADGRSPTKEPPRDKPAIQSTPHPTPDYLKANTIMEWGTNKPRGIKEHTADAGLAPVETTKADRASLAGWITATARALVTKMQHIRETRQGLAALQSLDDRMLKDIGLSRHEVEYMAMHGRVRPNPEHAAE